MCSASRTSTGWAQPEVAQGSGRERGESCSPVNQRGKYRDVDLLGNPLTTTMPPPATRFCAGNLLDESKNLRLVVIQTSWMRCLCALAVQLEARARRRRGRHVRLCSSVSSSSPWGSSVHTATPLDCEITVSSRVWTLMHADVTPLQLMRLANVRHECSLSSYLVKHIGAFFITGRKKY